MEQITMTIAELERLVKDIARDYYSYKNINSGSVTPYEWSKNISEVLAEIKN
jgi:hypothetical protein